MRYFPVIALIGGICGWLHQVVPAHGAGVEIFGTSNVAGAGLTVDLEVPVLGAPFEFLLGTYAHAGGTTPLGIAVPVGTLDSTITLRQGGIQLGFHDDLNGGLNRDAEIHSLGLAGRMGAAVITALNTGDYEVAFDRFNSEAANAAYAMAMNFPFVARNITKPLGSGSFTINDVLVSDATLLLENTGLDAANGVTVESSGTLDITSGTSSLDIVQIKSASTMRMHGGIIIGSQLIAGMIGNGSVYVYDGQIIEQVIRLGQGTGQTGNMTQYGGNVNTIATLVIGNETATPLSTYTLTGGSLYVGGMSLNASGRFLLAGGKLMAGSAGSIGSHAGRFTWASGTLELFSPSGVAAGLADVFPTGVELTTGKTLRLAFSDPVLDAPVNISGGELKVNTLPATAPVTLTAGKLTFEDPSGIDITAGTYFGDHLTLRPQATIAATQAQNHGLIDGGGTIAAPLTNFGEVRADAGNTLRFSATTASSNSAAFTLSGGRIEFTGQLNNGATGDITGRGTLAAAALNNAGDIAFSGGTSDVYGAVSNAAGGRIIVSGAANATFWDDVANGAGGSIKVASGCTVTFFGAYAGGGIAGTGSVYFEADIAPGFSPAAIALGGDAVFGAAAKLKMELAGTTPGTQYDQLHVAGALALDGELEVSLDGFAPAAGQSFDILDWGTLSGTFATINLPALSAGLAWSTSQLYATGTLNVVAVGVPGDYNGNGTVDAADYVLWRNGGPLTNEVDTPGVVNAADYTAWRARFGNSGGSGMNLRNAALPEPALAVLASVGCALLACVARGRPVAKRGC